MDPATVEARLKAFFEDDARGALAVLVHRVLRDGRLVLDRDRSARIRFEVRSRNEYFDMAPIRRLYRRYPAPATVPAPQLSGHEPSSSQPAQGFPKPAPLP